MEKSQCETSSEHLVFSSKIVSMIPSVKATCENVHHAQKIKGFGRSVSFSHHMNKIHMFKNELI